MRKLIRNRKGQGLVEYALIIAGVALICAVAIAVFGHKVTDMVAATAVIMPGAHPDDNNPITSGHIIETTKDANGNIVVDAATIAAQHDTSRLFNNIMGSSGAPANPDTLVAEPIIK